MYMKKMNTLILKDICTSEFIAALFIITKTFKQTKCPLIDEQVKKVWYIFTAIKKKEAMPCATT